MRSQDAVIEKRHAQQHMTSNDTLTSDNTSDVRSVAEGQHPVRHHGKHRSADATPASLAPSHDVIDSLSDAPGGASSTTPAGVQRAPRNKTKVEPVSSRAHRLLKIAHALHYCSIAILAVFVVQVLVKMLCMRRDFFHDKLEVLTQLIPCTATCRY